MRTRLLILFLILVGVPARADWWIEYTEEWRSANARMIREGVMPERIGPFRTREEAQAQLDAIAGAHGVSDGIGWSSCMGDYLYVSGSDDGGGYDGGYEGGGSDYDWAAYYQQQAELRRRAQEEDRQRMQQRQEGFAASKPGALNQVQGRVWSTTGSSTAPVSLPPINLTGPKPTPTPGLVGIRTIKVPVPPPSTIEWCRASMMEEDEPPAMRLWLSPEAAALLGLVAKSIREAPLKLGETLLSALGAGPYLSVLKLGKGLSDETQQSLDKAMDLMRRGYPEEETREFVNGSEQRILRVYVNSMSDIALPEYLLWLLAYMERSEGVSYWERPGVYENLKQMCEGAIAEPKQAKRHTQMKTVWAVLAWRCGQYQDARRLLDELGPKAIPQPSMDYFQKPLSAIRNEVYQHTGGKVKGEGSG
ncbi:MAG: hypothetical protein GX446_13050 [Chthonomonadales bacterium]|nr:hypothetical protein [Chthonomonadales bacterium]